MYDAELPIPYEGHTGQIHNVLLAINGEKEVLVDGIQGLQTLELITAIYQSANTGKTVKLPLTKEDPSFTREGILKNAKHFDEKKNIVENFSDNVITTGGKYEGLNSLFISQTIKFIYGGDYVEQK
ncbi:Gfo/Idh/MocA family oxidoreductase [Neobacillus sp. Marseille-QA0830]